MLQPRPIFIFAHHGASFIHTLGLSIVFVSYLNFLILSDLCPETERNNLQFFFYVIMKSELPAGQKKKKPTDKEL